MEQKRNILLCVAGGTPAIITETLWALMHAKPPVRIDEVRVITTREGRDKILTGKINGRGAADESLLDPDAGQIFKFLRDYPEAGPIKFDANSLYILTTRNGGVPSPRDHDNERLADILNDHDNEIAAKQICEVVQELASDNEICIHASIAGGRKTMGLYLMAAMQLFGRTHDAISHVLVSKEAEFGAPKFFYKTPQAQPILDPAGKQKIRTDGAGLSTEDINIHLANIPFVRLRGLGAKMLDKPVTCYARIVNDAQDQLEFLESANELRLSPRKRTVKVFNREAKFTLREMFVYTMFTYFRQNDIGEDGYVGLDEISERDLGRICRLFAFVEDGCNPIDEFRAIQRRANFVDSFMISEVKQRLLDERRRNYRKYNLPSPRDARVTNEEASAEVLQSYREALSRISEKLEEANIDPKFDIARKGTKGGYRFGLEIDAQRIKFE